MIAIVSALLLVATFAFLYLAEKNFQSCRKSMNRIESNLQDWKRIAKTDSTIADIFRRDFKTEAEFQVWLNSK